MKSVMSYNPQPSSYTDEVNNVKKTNSDFLIKQQLYEEYKKKKREGFNGTFEEYLNYRDYS